MKLIDKSEKVNKFLSPIISCIVLFAAPTTCTLVFAMQQTDGFVRIVVAGMTFVYILFNTIILYLYAKLDTVPFRIHERLSQFVAHDPDLRDKRLLLMIMEHVASESSLLGMYLSDQSRFDVRSFVTYLMEIATQYLLVLTLKDMFGT